MEQRWHTGLRDGRDCVIQSLSNSEDNELLLKRNSYIANFIQFNYNIIFWGHKIDFYCFTSMFPATVSGKCLDTITYVRGEVLLRKFTQCLLVLSR